MLMHMLDAGRPRRRARDDVYGGTFRIFDKVFKRQGLELLLRGPVQAGELRGGASRPKTKMVWVETPTNPMLKLIDLARVAEVAKKREHHLGLRQHLHDAVLPAAAGAGLRRRRALDDEVPQRPQRRGRRLRRAPATTTSRRRCTSCRTRWAAVPGPMDSFLVLRGVKTLHVRMERHAQNAMKVAEFLAAHPKVQQGHLPGPREPPAARAGAQADEGLRRHDDLRHQGRAGGGAHVPQDGEGLRLRRVARRAWSRSSSTRRS